MKTPIAKSKDSIIKQINNSLKGSVKAHALNAINRLCERDELIPLNKNYVWQMRGIGKVAIDFFEEIGVVEKLIGETIPYRGLSVRASRVLEWLDVKSPQEAAEKIKNGVISLHRVRLCGKKTRKEICHWAGIPEFSDGTPIEQEFYKEPLIKAMIADFQQNMPNGQNIDIDSQFRIDNVEKVLKKYFFVRRKISTNS